MTRPKTEWQALKKEKTQAREQRYQHELAKIQERSKWLGAMERKVIAEGRMDFNAEEIYQMLWEAYLDAREGKRGTYDVQRFEVHLAENLLRVAKDIAEHNYYPIRSEAFVVFDPVIREIFAASFRDRVVHHLLINICMPWWNRHFIRDSYSCRLGKGTDYGVHRAKLHIARVSENYTRPAYFVKMDIKGFFMSMDREKLLERAVLGTHQQFPDFGPLGRLAVYLWRQIIRDDPLKEVRIRGKMRDWDQLPRDKSMFFQPKGHGIVIGNLTSQLLSNIFLDDFDKFMVYQLGYHHYGRYVDDFFTVVTKEELPQMKRDMEVIRSYLAGMGLTLHPKKTKWIPVEHGVEYLGKVIYNGHVEMSKRYQDHYRQALREVVAGKRDIDSLVSYMGGCSNYGCRKMQEKIWRQAGLDFNK